MNVVQTPAAPDLRTAQAFLAWEDRQEGRHEYVAGRIVPMTGGSRAHQRVVMNVTMALMRAIDPAAFDAIYFTGGHAVMWDFPNSDGLQSITRAIWERGGVVSAVCHGYCGLLNTRLSDGTLLAAGRRVTGFSWTEEILAAWPNTCPSTPRRR